MKHLLDVNMLIAGIVEKHGQHAQAFGWLEGRQIVLCPICELGFLRICSHPRTAIGLTIGGARSALEKFAAERKADRIPDDLPALESHPLKSDQVTDHYLAELAAKHGLKLATFDKDIRHPSVEVVPA
jgi:uncharacterized protein